MGKKNQNPTTPEMFENIKQTKVMKHTKCGPNRKKFSKVKVINFIPWLLWFEMTGYRLVLGVEVQISLEFLEWSQRLALF